MEPVKSVQIDAAINRDVGNSLRRPSRFAVTDMTAIATTYAAAHEAAHLLLCTSCVADYPHSMLEYIRRTDTSVVIVVLSQCSMGGGRTKPTRA